MQTIELKLTEEDFNVIINLLGKGVKEDSFWDTFRAVNFLVAQATPQLKPAEPVAETPEA